MANRLTQEEFIKKSITKHGYKYDYELVIYTNRNSKVKIICPIHGVFIQKASDHYHGCGCPKCDPTSTLGREKFISKSINIHGNLYDYTEVVYVKNNIKVIIGCKKHGIFTQQPSAHLRGQGCPRCINNKKKTTDQFIIDAKNAHGNLYDYKLVEYKTKKEKVNIICPKHGIFSQKAYVHLLGHGCSMCNNSKLEMYLREKLIYHKIKFEQNKRFEDCRNILCLPFDFFLMEKKILIECDGIHHFKPIEHFGGDERFKYQQKNDSIKSEYCSNRQIPLYRVKTFLEIDNLLFKLT